MMKPSPPSLHGYVSPQWIVPPISMWSYLLWIYFIWKVVATLIKKGPFLPLPQVLLTSGPLGSARLASFHLPCFKISLSLSISCQICLGLCPWGFCLQGLFGFSFISALRCLVPLLGADWVCCFDLLSMETQGSPIGPSQAAIPEAEATFSSLLASLPKKKKSEATKFVKRLDDVPEVNLPPEGPIKVPGRSGPGGSIHGPLALAKIHGKLGR